MLQLVYLPTVIVKNTLLVAAIATATVAAAEDPMAHSPWLHKWSDVQLYLKPKYNGIRTWDQEFGIQATTYKSGNFSQVTNFAYDPTYPIRLNQKPRFSVGMQFNYYLTKLPWRVAVYTKPKASPFPYTYKDESGFTWRFYTSKNFIVSSNLAYVFNIPFHQKDKPQWLALVNFQFPLG